MKRYLGNAFSLQMIPSGGRFTVRPMDFDTFVENVSEGKVRFESVIGHADLAAVLSEKFGSPVAFNRVNVILQPSDRMYVAQVMGGRLPEGTTTLPEGFTISMFYVTMEAEATPIGRGQYLRCHSRCEKTNCQSFFICPSGG